MTELLVVGGLAILDSINIKTTQGNSMKRIHVTLLAVSLAAVAWLGSGCAAASHGTLAPSEARAGFAQANGINIAYESFGATDHEAVLLIAGTGRQLTDWPLELVDRLVSRGFRVVRFDNRDVGLSTTFDAAGYPDSDAIARALEAGTPAPIPYTLQDMARDAVGLLDALGVQRAHIVGISMGGAIAQLVAIDHPEHVLSLTLMMADSGDPALPPIAKPEVFADIPPPPAEGDRAGFIEYDLLIRQAQASPGYPTDPQRLRSQVERDIARSYEPDGLTRQATVSLVGHIESADYRRSNLKQITAPTVVLHGTDDPVVAVDSARQIAAQVPLAELRIIEGLGHDIPLVLVDQFADAIAAAAARTVSQATPTAR